MPLARSLFGTRSSIKVPPFRELTAEEAEEGVTLLHGALRPRDVEVVEALFRANDIDDDKKISKAEFKVGGGGGVDV